MPDLRADHGELEKFVKALFRYADPGTYASLRAFDQFRRDVPPEVIWAVQINGDLGKLVERAEAAIAKCGTLEKSTVFAPPICTFTNPDRARGVDLANGLTLSVELDEGDTLAARRKLEALLGPATVVVASGGDWTDLTTGEIHTKLHLHWRLSEPTRDQEDHAKLGHARDLAARLCGADPTGKPVVHPLRWPGSWNTKDKPRMARVAALNESAEINLDEALEAVQEAVEAAGLASVSIPRSGTPEAPQALLESAMQAIPNPGVEIHYDQWIRFGYAAYRASGGSSDGYELWDTWSRRSDKFNAAETELAWARIAHAVEGSSAPRTIGAGTIFFYAMQAGWRRPQEEAPELGPPPDDTSDPGYLASLEEDDRFHTTQHDAAEAATRHDTRAEPVLPFPATGVTQAELDALTPREWVYGHFLIRRFISAIGAPGGAGKTAYAYAVALAIMAGSELLGETVHDPGNVWIYNLEDPRNELLKRLKAALLGHGIDFSEIADRIFLDSGRDRPLVIARAERDGTVVAWPHVPALIEELKARKIRLLIVDPFVRSHRVEENVNDHIDFVAALWAEVADKADCAVLLVHHFKKGGQSGDAGAFRGASALIDASRAAVTIATMSQDEAKKFDIPDDDRWQYVRVDNAKLNLAPPPGSAVWLRLTGVDIENAANGRPSDQVQTVTRWSAPSPWSEFSMATVVRVLEKLQAGPDDGEQYTLTRGGKSTRWAGAVLVDLGGKSEPEAIKILRAWVASGLVESGRYTSPKQRKERDGLIVNPAKLAELRSQPNSAPWSTENE